MNESHENANTPEKKEHRMGRYVLLNMIGEGGMGKVYKANDTILEREVALKILKGDSEQDAITRFFREARATARLDHPNIVPLYDMGEVDGLHFLTMKFIEGGSLSWHLHNFSITLEESCLIMIKVLDAMHYAHQMGFLHRDIKPSNILIGIDGEPYLTDFGLVKFLNSDVPAISQTGLIMGTISYMSYEQAHGDAKIDSRADIYSLGAVLYEMIVGETLFQGDTIDVILARLSNGDIIPPRSKKPEISSFLEKICLKSLHRDKRMRYQTAREMKQDLEKFLQSSGPQADVVSPASPSIPENTTKKMFGDKKAKAILPRSALENKIANQEGGSTEKFSPEELAAVKIFKTDGKLDLEENIDPTVMFPPPSKTDLEKLDVGKKPDPTMMISPPSKADLKKLDAGEKLDPTMMISPPSKADLKKLDAGEKLDPTMMISPPSKTDLEKLDVGEKPDPTIMISPPSKNPSSTERQGITSGPSNTSNLDPSKTFTGIRFKSSSQRTDDTASFSNTKRLKAQDPPSNPGIRSKAPSSKENITFGPSSTEKIDPANLAASRSRKMFKVSPPSEPREITSGPSNTEKIDPKLVQLNAQKKLDELKSSSIKKIKRVPLPKEKDTEQTGSITKSNNQTGIHGEDPFPDSANCESGETKSFFDTMRHSAFIQTERLLKDSKEKDTQKRVPEENSFLEDLQKMEHPSESPSSRESPVDDSIENVSYKGSQNKEYPLESRSSESPSSEENSEEDSVKNVSYKGFQDKEYPLESSSSEDSQMMESEEKKEVFHLEGREHLEEKLQELFDTDTPGSFIILDLDNFESYVQFYGALKTQEILENILDALISALEGRAHIYREISTGTFTLVMPYSNSRKSFLLAETTRKYVEKFQGDPSAAETQIKLSLSGVVLAFSGENDKVNDLIDKGQESLIQVKEKGGNAIVTPTSSTNLVLTAVDFSSPVLLGCEKEIEQAKSVLVSETAKILLFSSPRGYGKTKLLREIQALAGFAFYHSCREAEIEEPYSCVARIIDQYFMDKPGEIEEAVKQMWDEEIHFLKPLLRFLRPVKTSKISPNVPLEKIRKTTYEGICFLLEYIAKDEKLAILLDDIQYVDQVTLYVFDYFLRIQKVNIQVIATINTDLIVDETPFFKLEERFRSRANWQEMSLPGLSSEEIRGFLSTVLEDYDPLETVRILNDLSQGNASYIENALTLLYYREKLIKKGEIWFFDIEEGDLPASLEELILELVKEFQSESSLLIQQAAVIGDPFSFNYLEETSEYSGDQVRQFIEEAKQLGLVEETEEDVFRFKQSSFQNLIYYEIADESMRSRVHEKVSQLMNRYKVGDGREGHGLTHHLNRSSRYGNSPLDPQVTKREKERRKLFEPDEDLDMFNGNLNRRMKRVFVESVELSENDISDLKSWMHSFTLSVQQVQRYPEGSSLITSSVKALHKSMEKTWKNLTGFITKIEDKYLLLNNAELEKDTPIVREFYQLLRGHYISSMTLDANIESYELEKIMRALGEPGQKIVLNPDYWTEFLDEAEIKSVDILQKVYVSNKQASGDLEQASDEMSFEDDTLGEESIRLVRDIIRYLCASVENIQLYPSQSKLLNFSVELLTKALDSFFQKREKVSFAIANNDFLVENYMANPHIFGNQIFVIQRIFNTQNIHSCTLRKEVSLQELLDFSHQLAQPANAEKDENYWPDFIQRHKTNNIIINNQEYKEMQIQELMEPELEIEELAGGDEKSWVELDLAEKLNLVMRMDEEELFNPDMVEGMEELMITLQKQDQTEFQTLVTKISSNLRSKIAGVRFQVCELLSELKQRLPHDVKNLLLVSLNIELQRALSLEPDLTVHQKLLDIAKYSLTNLYREKEFEKAHDLLRGLIKQRDRSDLGVGINETLDELIEEVEFNQIAQDLFSSDKAQKAFSHDILETLGERSSSILLDEIQKNTNQEERKTLAKLLRSWQGNVDEKLDGLIHPKQDAAVINRLLDVLEDLTEKQEKFYEILLSSPNLDIQNNIMSIIEGWKPAQQYPICIRTLKRKIPENIQRRMVMMAGKIKCAEATESIIQTLETTSSLSAKRACCRTLGEIGDTKALPILLGMANRKKLWGLTEEEKEEKIFSSYALQSFDKKDIEAALVMLNMSKDEATGVVTSRFRKRR